MPQVDATSVLQANSKVSFQKNVNDSSCFKVIISNYLNHLPVIM